MVVRLPGSHMVDARLIRSLSDSRLVQKAHSSGRLRVLKRGKNPVVLQPVKSSDWSYTLSRNLAQPFGKKRVLVSKGTGAVRLAPDGKSFLNEIGFSHNATDELSSRQFWGGLTRKEAEHVHYFSSMLQQHYERARTRKTGAWRLAAKYGVGKPPFPLVVSTTKPRRNVLVVNSAWVKKNIDSPLLSKKEKKLLKYLLGRGELADGKKKAVFLRNALTFQGIPRSLQRSQVIQNYILRTNLRLSPHEFSTDPRPFLEANGLRVVRNSWHTPNGKALSDEAAADYAIMHFSASLALGINLMHKKLNGSFSTKIGERWLSSLSFANITQAGEICDLDTCQYGAGREAIREAQEKDLLLLTAAILNVCGKIRPGGPTQTTIFDRAHQLAENIIKQP